MRWLITGGCGFIGRNLVADLLSDGVRDIRVLDNFSAADADELAAFARARVHVRRPADPVPEPSAIGIDVLRADILDRASVFEATLDRDIVVHLAANTGVAPSVADPEADCHVNVIGTLNCLEAARHGGARRFVFASSGAPLGNAEPPIDENTPPRPVSPYGASKMAGEGYCSAYAGSFGLATVALRFGNVYGPGSTHKSSVVARFIGQALKGEAWEIFGDGGQTRDFIFVEDLVDAIRRAAEAGNVAGEVFQIATSAETSVSALAAELADVLARHGIARPDVRHGELRQGDLRRSCANTAKALGRLGWQSRTTLGDGLERTVAWFLGQATSDR